MAAATTETNGKSILVRIAELRAWLFLIFLAVFFETWSRVVYGQSFVFNVYNLQSISVFATAPLMLALGQTFVIISAGIDLSLGFIMGLSSVVAAHVANYFALKLGLGPFPAMLIGNSRRHFDCVHPWPRQWLDDCPFAGACLHRYAWHVWCGSRFGLSPRRRHDRFRFPIPGTAISAMAGFSAFRCS